MSVQQFLPAAGINGQLLDIGPKRKRPDVWPQRPYTRRLLALLAVRKRTLAGILAASLFLNLCGLVVPRVTQAILDRLVPGTSSDSSSGGTALLTQFVLLMAGVTVFQIGLTIWRRLTLVKMSLELDRVLLGEFCAHLLSLPLGFFKKQRSGDLVARFDDHQHIRHLFASCLPTAAIDSLMVAVYFAVMFYYSIPLALIVIAFLLVFAGYTLLLSPLLKRLHQKLLEDKAVHESQLVDILAGIDLVKTSAVENSMREHWSGVFGKYLESNYRAQKQKQIFESIGFGVKFLIMVSLIWYGATSSPVVSLPARTKVAFSMYTSQAVVPLLGIITLWDEVQRARASLARMQQVLDEEPEQSQNSEANHELYESHELEKGTASYSCNSRDSWFSLAPVATNHSPVTLHGHVRSENVTFHYPGLEATPVLHDLSFEIHSGERVALIGPSGCGKTTIARLLLGLYRPTSGRILIDGHGLATLDLGTYRKQVGVVLQENLLISGTIRDNIALGGEHHQSPRPIDDGIIKAGRLAGAHDFVSAFPHGYDTVVGELGLMLSGGQRQRIALARALYRDPRILILDEAFNALDAESLGAIAENWGRITTGRTVLVIAHEVRELLPCDRVIAVTDSCTADLEKKMAHD